MSVYLDSGVLIAHLYEEYDQAEKAREANQFFEAITNQRVQALISFYALPELYGYVATTYAEVTVNETFRISLVELFRAPLIVKPFLERIEMAKLRRRFTISDSTDVSHVAAALFFQCSGIITFDHHFREVATLIPVYTPDEFLATLEGSAGMPESE